jgi:cell shape-determining protein MreC
MTETDLENQRLREQLNHAALRVLELEQECQQLKTAQVDRSETIKEAYIWGMLLADTDRNGVDSFTR